MPIMIYDREWHRYCNALLPESSAQYDATFVPHLYTKQA